MRTGIQPLRVTLAAGADDVYNTPGRFFHVKEASDAAFELSIDDGPFVPWDSGMGYQVPDDEEAFHQLHLRNTSVDAMDFQILIARGRVFDQRLNIVANRLGAIAQDGVDGTGLTPPTGGSGIRGWLSGVYDRLKATGPIGTLLDGIDTLVNSILTGVAAISAQLPATLGQKAKAASLAVTLASDSDALAVTGPLTDTQLRATAVPVSGTVTANPPAVVGAIVTAQTAATGTNWTAYGSAACTSLEIFNNTGTAIEYRRGGAGAAVALADGVQRSIRGIANANEIEIRRVDTSNTQVTVPAETIA